MTPKERHERGMKIVNLYAEQLNINVVWDKRAKAKLLEEILTDLRFVADDYFADISDDNFEYVDHRSHNRFMEEKRAARANFCAYEDCDSTPIEGTDFCGQCHECGGAMSESQVALNWSLCGGHRCRVTTKI